jgi:hypothetical protein
MELAALTQRISDLRVLQMLLPTANEKRFMDQAWLSSFFHLPVRSTFGIRFYPISEDLIPQLSKQINDFVPFNSFCFKLHQCCSSCYISEFGFSDPSSLELLQFWGEAVERGDYYSTPSYFHRFLSVSNMPFSPSLSSFRVLQSILEAFSPDLLYTWQLSFLVPSACSVDLLSRLASSGFADQSLIFYVELSGPSSNSQDCLEKFTVYLHSQLSVLNIMNFFDDFLVVLGLDSLKDVSYSQNYGHMIQPGFFLQRGFAGLKKILSLTGKIDFYYRQELKYAFGIHDSLPL